MTSSKVPSSYQPPSFLKWTAWFSTAVHLPLWTYAVSEVAQGNIEPLVGGPLENLIVMLGMSSFYAGFFLGPSLLLHAHRRKKKRPSTHFFGKKEALLLGILGGFLVLFSVHRLPLNGLEPWAVGALLVFSGALSAGAVHVVGSRLCVR